MDAQDIAFVSLGMVVLDEIRLPGQDPLTDIVGGSGAYATLGARLFMPPPFSASLGWNIRVGYDFPPATQAKLESWDLTLIIDKETEQPSTRGLLEYEDTTFGPKKFRYTTSPLRVSDSSLRRAGLLQSKVFHYLEEPSVISGRIANLLALRQHANVPKRPLIIWEPAPPACKPENLPSFLEALSSVDVVSPNHLELIALFAESPPSNAAQIDKDQIETLADKLLEQGVGPHGTGTVVVRAGEAGCLVRSREIEATWLPPFYTSQEKVVDPTGAGNAFLGAFGVGYLRTGRAVAAACYGVVGASFALEQVGMPVRSDDGKREGEEEKEGEGEEWNAVRVLSRLEEYRSQIGARSSR